MPSSRSAACSSRLPGASPTRIRRATGLEPEELLHSRLQGYVQFEPRPEGLVPVPAVAAPVVVVPAPASVPAPAAAVEELGERRAWTPRLQQLFAVGSLVAIADQRGRDRGQRHRPAAGADRRRALRAGLSPFAILLGSTGTSAPQCGVSSGCSYQRFRSPTFALSFQRRRLRRILGGLRERGELHVRVERAGGDERLALLVVE